MRDGGSGCRVGPFEDAGDELFGVRKALGDELDVHGRFAELTDALAVDSVLADEHQSIGDAVEGDGEATAVAAHHEFVLFEIFATLLVNRHQPSF